MPTINLCYKDLAMSFKHRCHFLSQVKKLLVNNNSETVNFLLKVREDPNSFCCHFQASIFAYLIVYEAERLSKASLNLLYSAWCMLGNKAPRLEGMK